MCDQQSKKHFLFNKFTLLSYQQSSNATNNNDFLQSVAWK